MRAVVAALAIALTACADTHDLPIPPGAHVIEDRALDEMSGLEPSAVDAGMLWAINDRALPPRLYRTGVDGSALGRVRVTGVWMWDTEALGGWQDDGVDWLLVGDIGDNRARRDHVRVHAVAEPGPDDVRARVAWTLAFRYPDGARDAEAMAVDHTTGDLLIVSKRDSPARVYRVPLAARASDSPVVAEFVMVLPEGTVRDEVTGIDICDDGLRLVMLTYTSVHLWQRELGEGWRETLARAPRSIPLPRLAKAEAISFSADGQSIHVASERLPTPLVTIELPTP